MTDTERIAQLEAEVAELKLALEAERKERAALPEILVPKTAETQRGLTTLEQNFELTMKAIDARVAELAERGGSAELTEDVCELYRGTLWLLKQQQATWERLRWLDEGRTRDLERLSRLLDALGGPQAA